MGKLRHRFKFNTWSVVFWSVFSVSVFLLGLNFIPADKDLDYSPVSIEVDYAFRSSLGGAIVPASCPSYEHVPGECGPICVPYEGTTCSASNNCGDISFGTIGCDGGCSAIAPPARVCGPICVPDGTCSAPEPTFCGTYTIGVDSCGVTCLKGFPCIPSPSHSACQGGACVVIDGAGADECSTNADCSDGGDGGDPTHLECVSSSCVSVSGPGSNSCSSSADCGGGGGPFHFECVSSSCAPVPGAGADLCTTSADCGGGGGGPTHLECVSSSCISVSGPGANSCSSAGSACSPPDIRVTPGVIARGGSATLTWLAPGATLCSAIANPVTSQWQGTVCNSLITCNAGGSRPVSPLQSTTYYINCNTGSDNAMLSVGIIEEPAP